jgi:hypothetical protein
LLCFLPQQFHPIRNQIHRSRQQPGFCRLRRRRATTRIDDAIDQPVQRRHTEPADATDSTGRASDTASMIHP